MILTAAQMNALSLEGRSTGSEWTLAMRVDGSLVATAEGFSSYLIAADGKVEVLPDLDDRLHRVAEGLR